MKVETIDIDKIQPAKYNPRKDLKPGDPEYDKLKKSITEFDMVEPLILNKRGNVLIGGHQRLKVLKEMGRTEVEVSVVDLPPAKEKALNIALNKISGSWLLPELKDILQEIDTGEFDIEITGFDSKEIEDLINQLHQPEDGLTDDDEVPEPQESICKPGDLWVLGEHRLLCGDATVVTDVERLMGGEKADMVFTDPPFEMESTGYMENLILSTSGAILVMHSDANMVKLAAKYNEIFHYFIVHYYSFGFARSKCSPQMAHHLIGVFGDAHFINNQDGFKTVICEQMERGKLMPYQKRVAIPEQCIKHYNQQGIVTDPFLGSGSTLIACEKLGRRCYGMEIDPHYCDVIIQRFENFTGKTAILQNY
jgi:16S rRNA G966 N2-methylase RsmD